MLAAEGSSRWIGELEGAGSDFDRVSQHLPARYWQGKISCAQDQEGSAAEIGETKLKRAIAA